MKPTVVFADPEAELRAYLLEAWADRPEAYAPTKVTTDFPSAALAGDATWIQLELESGDVSDYPVTERAQVRVVCYAAKNRRSNAKALASLTQGLLHAHPGSEKVAGVVIRGGRSAVTPDPDTENLMVWFLVRVDLLATSLAP